MTKGKKKSGQATVICSLRVKNIARITEVEVVPPKSGAIIVSGDNAAGKTTLIKAILAGFGFEVPAVRKGEETGEIDMETDALKMRVVQTAGKTRLIVIDKATGHSLRGPKGILKELFGKRSFDATAFMLASPKKQAEALLGVLDLKGSKEKLAAICGDGFIIDGESVPEWVNDAYSQVYAERRVVNRDIKRLTGVCDQFASLKDIKPVDLQDLYELKDKAMQREALRDKVKVQTLAIECLESDLLVSRARLEAIQSELKELEPYKLEEINEEIVSAKQTNVDAAKCAEKVSAKTELERHAKRSAALTATMQGILDYRTQIMDAAKLPIPGLDLRNGEIQYNGHSLQDASGAERARVAIAIARQEVPADGLQALFVLDPPQLDAASWRTLEEYAKAEGIQLWIARVSEQDERGEVHLVEGCKV